jgi:hypothetical protein
MHLTRNKIRTLIILILCINAISIKAMVFQDSTKNKNYDNSKNKILISPLSYFDPFNPAIQIGFQRKVSKKIGLQFEVAYIPKISGINLLGIIAGDEDIITRHKGYKLRAESKFYQTKDFYWSLEMFYIKNYTTNQVATFAVSTDPNFVYNFEPPETFSGAAGYSDYFDIDKEKIGLTIKAGLELQLIQKWFVDISLGVGIVRRESIHLNRLNYEDDYYIPLFSFITKDGITYLPNLPINIKFGYYL